MTKLWNWLCRIFSDDDDPIIDHVKIKGGMTRKKIAKARAATARRHGKPFHVDKIKKRETPPSRDLEDLNKASGKTIIVDEQKVRSIK